MSNDRIIDKLRKVLALTNSPEEGEAQAAAETLQRLLTEYNLSMADLETRGQNKPSVGEKEHDLGKAAFQWKLDLAEVMAEHYYCWPIIDRRTKTVKFVGRPDNVDSFQLLYGWVIDQIKRIASEERRHHIVDYGEHVDPLRWQLHFGLGCVSRLSTRLREMKERQESATDVVALVLSHKTEISDFMEQKYGKRIDGKRTKEEEKWHMEYEERQRTKAELKERDIEAFYRAYPWERPLTPEQQIEQDKVNQEWEKKQARNARRRTGRTRQYSEADFRRDEQAYTANRAGRSAGDKVNLQPFIEGQKKEDKKLA